MCCCCCSDICCPKPTKTIWKPTFFIEKIHAEVPVAYAFKYFSDLENIVHWGLRAGGINKNSHVVTKEGKRSGDTPYIGMTWTEVHKEIVQQTGARVMHSNETSKGYRLTLEEYQPEKMLRYSSAVAWERLNNNGINLGNIDRNPRVDQIPVTTLRFQSTGPSSCEITYEHDTFWRELTRDGKPVPGYNESSFKESQRGAFGEVKVRMRQSVETWYSNQSHDQPPAYDETKQVVVEIQTMCTCGATFAKGTAFCSSCGKANSVGDAATSERPVARASPACDIPPEYAPAPGACVIL